MDLPIITRTNGTWKCDWPDNKVSIDVTRVKNHSDRVTGEIMVKSYLPGYPNHLHQAQYNFTSTRTQKEVSKILEERCPDIQWGLILEQLSVKLLEHVRAGNPAIEISTTDPVQNREFIIFPLIPENMPTIIFGDGGAGKGITGVFICYLLRLNNNSNSLGLKVNKTNIPILYLDWESDETDFRSRMFGIKQGMNLPDCKIWYRSCVDTLTGDIEKITKIVSELNIKMVVVDSLGPASGSDLNSPETALSFYSALRSLNITSLIIAHNSKNQLEKTKTVYGNVYFTNIARYIWELRKVQQVGENVINVGLYHRKSNISKLFNDIGLQITFGNEGQIVFKKLDTIKEPGLAEASNKIKDLILHSLYRGPKNEKAIAESISKDQKVVHTTLYRMLEEESPKVLQLEEKDDEGKTEWALAFYSEDENRL